MKFIRIQLSSFSSLHLSRQQRFNLETQAFLAKMKLLFFIREVLQTEFRFRFRKGPRQISVGPGWSTPEKVEPNFLFCKPNFLFRFGSIKKCVVLATRCIVMSKNTTEKLNLCLLLDHYSWN